MVSRNISYQHIIPQWGLLVLFLKTVWNLQYRDYAPHSIKPQLSETFKGDPREKVNLKLLGLLSQFFGILTWLSNCFNPERAHGAHYTTGIWKPSFHCGLILRFNLTLGRTIARCEGGTAQRRESEEPQEQILASTVFDPWQGWF